MFKTSTVKIQQSKTRGCEFCNAIIQAMNWANLWQEADQTLFLEALNPTTIAVDKSKWTKNSETVTLISINKNHGNRIKQEEPVISPSTLSFITRQLNNCLTNPHHSNCGPKWDSTTPWPARMLQITNNTTITLVPFDATTMPGNFAALSYCWGDGALLKAHPPLIATASTLPSLQAGIPIASLPLTLLQSAQIASLLSIRFIWIDSLCILQDSPRDWEVEATKMETVYAKAQLTIIAAASTSCHSGLEIRARLLSNSGYHSPFAPADPIDLRGWTYQEEHLSTRYVKFTCDDIQWKCAAGAVCGCGMPPAEEYTWQWKPSLEPMVRWERIAQKFSARRFTVWSDKLVAVSSLARRYAVEIGDSGGYVGGLWKWELVSQLAWVYPKGTGRCSREYIAPSWSWAGINSESPLVWEPKFDWELAEVVKTGRELVFEGNAFGKISGAFVKLRGPLFGCVLEVKDGGVLRVEVNDTPLQTTVRSAELDCMGQGADCPHFFEKKKCHVLLIGAVTRMINECWLYGLILGTLDGGKGYQRLGLLSLITDREAAPKREDLKQWAINVTIY
ncbi:heterokaryon incompatibility protein-domain-containing protein [Cladorrhinum sp. PSN332]|nr:heterokaryon incompatibility protein-domain-containing protein [Cladorrhinum sp. PSN332]